MKEILFNTVPGDAEWFDAVYITGKSTPVTFKNNRIYSVNESENSGFGVRVNVDGKTGFSYTNDPGGTADAVKRAVITAPYGEKETFKIPSGTLKSFEPYDEGIRSFDAVSEIAIAENFIRKIESAFPSISVDLSVSASSGSFRLLNSEGVDLEYKESLYSVSVSCSYVMKGGVKIDTWESDSGLKPLDYGRLASILIERIERALTPEKLDSGIYPVILPPSASARFAGMIASGLNGQAVWKGVSPLADKAGEKVFNELFTLIDDPRIPGSPYTAPFDGEGINTVKRPLINKGVVEGFIADLKYAERLGIEPTGNAARGFSSLPSPSFNGLTMEPGKAEFSEIIKGIDKGIVAQQFIGLGQSNTLNGDFSANLDLAFLVENGEIKGRLKDCMISGNVYDLMKGNIQVSSEMERNGSTFMPYICFEGVNFTS
jgi:PmbA protein